LEDELLAGKKQAFAQNSLLRNKNNNFLDFKEADFLTLNTVAGLPEDNIVIKTEQKKLWKVLATKFQSS